jgi:FMN phosphatase YigB (HAD superfamily)
MAKTLFIDLDGTIMQNPFWPAVFPNLADHLARQSGWPAATVLDLIIRENERREAFSAEDAVWAMDWDDIAQTVAGRLGVDCIASVERLVIDCCQPPYIAILDQADVALGQVMKQGWRIVAATHGLRRYQAPVLKALRLFDLLADIAAPDTRHCMKPQRGFWLPYLDTDRLVVHVGDLYSPDVVAPGSHGILPIWKTRPRSRLQRVAPALWRARLFTPRGQSVRPHAVIFSLSELPGVLARLDCSER